MNIAAVVVGGNAAQVGVALGLAVAVAVAVDV
jgi:hypothetical protein